MLVKVSHITLFVHNQDNALEFYKKLGFSIHTDAEFEGMRWLTIHLPEQKDVELALIKAETDDEKNLVGKQGLSKPFLSFESNDAYKDYETLKNNGITVLGEPVVEPWGISFGLKDLYGNMIYVNQPS